MQACHNRIIKEFHVHIVPDNGGICFTVKKEEYKADANLKNTTKQTEEN